MTDPELVAYIREHLELEASPDYLGTEGRVPAWLWYLPFGRDANNPFKHPIRTGITRLGTNSRDDEILTFFETILGKCEGTTPENKRASSVKYATLWGKI